MEKSRKMKRKRMLDKLPTRTASTDDLYEPKEERIERRNSNFRENMAKIDKKLA